MEIKRVSEETYESIRAYVDSMLLVMDGLDDLCFVTKNGKKYMICTSNDIIGIVENNEGVLNPYCIGKKNELIDTFATEKFVYELFAANVNAVKEVTRTNIETKDISRLTYLPAIEDHPKDIIEFTQAIKDETACLEFRYDVSQRKDLDGAIAFCLYHYPDVFRLNVLKQKLWFAYNKKYDYALGLEEDDTYYRPLFRIGEAHMGARKMSYDARVLIPEICERGFDEKIPVDMSSLLAGKNDTYKELKLISNEYKKYIRTQ